MGKKKKKCVIPMLSPEKYITTRARLLPLGKTYISRTAADTGTYAILVTRTHTGGTITGGIYLIDTYCLGVKYSTYFFSIDPDEFQESLRSSKLDYEEVEYAEAHNLIYGALEYAEEAGIEPAREFKVSEYILEPDDEKIPLMDFEFGHNGIRELIIGPDYQEMKYIPALEENVPEEFIVTGYRDRYHGEKELKIRYEATTGNTNPRSFNFDFHPFPHDPYPEDVEGVRHKELLDIFYPETNDLGTTLDAGQIAAIRAIPRDELLSDLRLIAAYELGEAEKEIVEYGSYNDVESNVMYHICAILTEIGGDDTKDIVNSIIQQSYYWHEEYLGDSGLDMSHSFIANAYENCPEELARMVVAQGYSAHARSTILFTLECIAQWNPTVRGRVEKELQDLAELLLHGDGSNLPLINRYTIGCLSNVIIGLQMRQALPLVKELYDCNLIDEKVFGDYEEAIEELSRVDEENTSIETRYTSLEQIYKAFTSL